VTVLVPTSPTPLTGFVVTFPEEEVVYLEMTVEEAFRFIVSGGVVAPTSQLPGSTGDFRQAPTAQGPLRPPESPAPDAG
jgi:uncharacterized membrane protein